MRCTPRLENALDYAQGSLERLGHDCISSSHLILGLLSLHGGVADNILRSVGLSIDSVEHYLSARHMPGEQKTIRGGRTLGNSAVLAIEAAITHAHRRQHSYLGVDHLLLGILLHETAGILELFTFFQIDRLGMTRTILEDLQSGTGLTSSLE